MVRLLWQGIGLYHLCSRDMYQFDVKFWEIQWLLGLSVTQFLGGSEVRQVFVIGKNYGCVSISLNIMSPFLECSNNSQELSVVYFIQHSVSVKVWDRKATRCQFPFRSAWVRTAPVAAFDASDSIWNGFEWLGIKSTGSLVKCFWGCQMAFGILLSIQISCPFLSNHLGVWQCQLQTISSNSLYSRSVLSKLQ